MSAAVPPAAPAGLLADDGTTALVPRSSSLTMGYLVRLPADTRGGLRPTIVYLHGRGERGDGSRADLARLTAAGLPGLAAARRLPAPARPFILLAPQTAADTWDPRRLRTWLGKVLGRYPVDPARLYLTGISMGGGGVVSYLDAFGPATAFAAVAPISGDWTPTPAVTGLPSCARLGRTPLWAFAGDLDPTVPYQLSVNLVGYLDRHCPAAAADRLTLFEGRFHDVWTHVYDLDGLTDRVRSGWQPYDVDIYTWFLEHAR